jgi:uncharacterized lipoprotein YehR (DUF1307 family)
MKKINMVLKPLLALSLIAAISSCNSGSQTKDETPANTTDTTAFLLNWD